jgi:hypothetical protein
MPLQDKDKMTSLMTNSQMMIYNLDQESQNQKSRKKIKMWMNSDKTTKIIWKKKTWIWMMMMMIWISDNFLLFIYFAKYFKYLDLYIY